MPSKNLVSLTIDHRKARAETSLGGIRLRSIPKARGLMSRRNELVWRFKTVRLTGLHSISWNRRFCDGSQLSDPRHSELLETARRFLEIIDNDPLETFEISSHGTVIQRTYVLFAIMDWAISLGHSRLSDIRPSDWESFKSRIAYGLKALPAKKALAGRSKITADRILEIFRVIQHLYDFKAYRGEDGCRIIADGLDFEPFEFRGDAISLARKLGAETGRTPTIPPYIALYYLDAAIQYVANFSDDIFELNERLRKLEAAPPGPQRRARGQADAELATILLKGLDLPRIVPMLDGEVRVPVLAGILGMQPSVLYEAARAKVITRFGNVVSRPPGPARLREISRLRADLRRTASTRTWKGSEPPQRRNFARKLGLPFSGKPGSASPWPLVNVGTGGRAAPNEHSLESATADLWSSIYMVIGSFMADRLSEMLHLEIGCISYGLDGPYLESPLFKDQNTDSGISGRRPCPEIVAKAVRVAEALGRAARERTGSTKLFMSSHRLGDSVIDETTMRKRLEDFGSRIGVPPDEMGQVWLVAPHELRRFFAQTWVWYYELGPGLDALRQHLRHIDIYNTIRYGASATQGEAMSEEQKDLTVQIFEKSLFYGLELDGPFGRKLRKLAARMRVRVADPVMLSEAIRDHVEHKGLLLHPMPWGYCAWWREAAKAAKCVPKSEQPNVRTRPANRKLPEVCGDGCANFATHEVFAAFWRESEQRHMATLARDGIPTVLRKAAAEGVRIARRYVAGQK